jgi:hypothetical protein
MKPVAPARTILGIVMYCLWFVVVGVATVFGRVFEWVVNVTKDAGLKDAGEGEARKERVLDSGRHVIITR